MSLGHGVSATISYFYFLCSSDSIWKHHSYLLSSKTACFHVLRVISRYLGFPQTSVFQSKKMEKQAVACCIRCTQLLTRLANSRGGTRHWLLDNFRNDCSITLSGSSLTSYKEAINRDFACCYCSATSLHLKALWPILHLSAWFKVLEVSKQPDILWQSTNSH